MSEEMRFADVWSYLNDCIDRLVEKGYSIVPIELVEEDQLMIDERDIDLILRLTFGHLGARIRNAPLKVLKWPSMSYLSKKRQKSGITPLMRSLFEERILNHVKPHDDVSMYLEEILTNHSLRRPTFHIPGPVISDTQQTMLPFLPISIQNNSKNGKTVLITKSTNQNTSEPDETKMSEESEDSEAPIVKKPRKYKLSEQELDVDSKKPDRKKRLKKESVVKSTRQKKTSDVAFETRVGICRYKTEKKRVEFHPITVAKVNNSKGLGTWFILKDDKLVLDDGYEAPFEVDTENFLLEFPIEDRVPDIYIDCLVRDDRIRTQYKDDKSQIYAIMSNWLTAEQKETWKSWSLIPWNEQQNLRK